MTIAAQRPTSERSGISRALMLIDGQAVEAHDDRVIEIENPANRQVIAQVPRGGEADVDRAVQAAARAFGTWRLVPPRERGRLLVRIADAVEAETLGLPSSPKLSAPDTRLAAQTRRQR